MAKFFKVLLRMLSLASVCFLILHLGQQHIEKMQTAPTYAELSSFKNNSPHYLLTTQKRTIEKSRSSTVRVLSLAEATGSIASSSGTYITMFGHYYVITTNHGILGNCQVTKIIVDSESHDCLRFIEQNEEVDYALIEINKIPKLSPIKIPRDMITSNREWKSSLSIMAKTFYTGFPNSEGPLTIAGNVAGHSQDGYIYINSYAWSGSSGSGVFSQKGKYMGFVLAIDVGSGLILSTFIQLYIFPFFDLHPTIIESFHIAVIFTVISMLRSWFWRTVFR